MSITEENQLKVTEIKKVSRYIDPITERMLWGASAGICEFAGCRNLLYSHHVTKEKINFSQKAHIYAFSAGGKRPSTLRLSSKINDIDNLMLICGNCHKLIDSNATDYTAEQLLAMKKEHEDRVRIIASIKPDLQSEIVIYNANIANRTIKISDFAAKSAIIPDFYPARENPINLSPDLSLFDNEQSYWSVMATHLERQWSLYSSIIRDKHISLFAIAPQPLLFKLGTLINRNYNVDVMQSQGSIDNWKWKCDKQTAEITTQRIAAIDPNTAPIITFELTAKLSIEELQNTFGGGSIYRITTPNCAPEIIKSKEDLKAVMCEYRSALNHIKETNSQANKVKLIPISPCSILIEAGRQTMKGDPEIMLYDRNYVTKQWEHALTLNGKE